MKSPVTIIGCILILFAASPASAQVSAVDLVQSRGPSIFISVTPAYPAPNTTADVSLDSSYIDLSTSAISWSINGKTVPGGVGASHISVPVGDLGTQIDIAASVTGTMGSGSASAQIIPGSVDVMWEAYSYTPPFFKGRSLVAPGTTIRLFAVPHIISQKTKKELAASSLMYTWRRGSARIASLSGIGKTSAVVTAPALFGSETYTVEVTDPTGTAGGAGFATLTTKDPVLALYIDNPLFGTLYRQAISAFASSASDVALVAVPYYVAPARIPKLAYEWRVNGSPVEPDMSAPREITIRSQGNSSASISLSIFDAQNAFLSGSGSWSVSFGQNTQDNSANDSFHATQQ